MRATLTFSRLIGRSLRFHWRSHLGVWLGAVIGSTALIGALVVGDSVRESLRERALARVGGVDLALDSGDRLFDATLVDRLAAGSTAEPATLLGPWAWRSLATLHLRGTASRQDGSARAHDVQIYGSHPRFGSLAPWYLRHLERLPTEPLSSPDPSASKAFSAAELAFGQRQQVWTRPAPGKVLLNAALAEQLQAKVGDALILRMPKPGALSQDAVLTPRNESSVALRVEVEAILSADDFGEFSLKSGQRPALNAFVNPDELSRLTGVRDRANLLLLGEPVPLGGRPPGRREIREVLSEAAARLAARWRLDDGELAVRVIEQPTAATGGEMVGPVIEVATRRIFLDPPVAEAALRPRTNLLTGHAAFGSDTPAKVREAAFVTHGLPLVTYLANSLQAGDRLVPYSMVTAAGPPWTPADLGPDEIVVNEWLARELAVKPGDRVTLAYFDPEAGARLIERTNQFTVRSVVPMRGIYADRTLMPDFPGLAKAESTADWDAGFPLVHRIRDQDEAYWQDHRGTPKAFVRLETGRKLWGNRFGDLTAIRYFVPTNAFASGFRQVVEANLLANLTPADLGLAFRPVRQQALTAASSGQDFGGLFIGFSLFLVVAALLLMGLLFQFGLEQRLSEVGTLLALGFRPRIVRRLWLGEGIVLAALGGLVGVAGGFWYARMLIHGLTTVWRDAVAGASLGFHATPASLGIGLTASVMVATFTIWLTLRRQFARPARELLAGEVAPPRLPGRSRGTLVGAISLVVALGLVGSALARGDSANAAVFFGAGSLLLIAGLAFTAAALTRRRRASGRRDDAEAAPTAAISGWSKTGLAVRGTTRRRSRSLSTAALLACGSFLIAAIGAFRMEATRDAWRRDSGTGGFALIGEASLPVAQDLNAAAGREFYGLDPGDLDGVNVLPLRVRDGDDASCLNLDRAQRPRILGVDPQGLARRGAFRFASLEKGLAVTNGWLALAPAGDLAPDGRLDRRDPAGPSTPEIPEIPAIGDAASIQWALGRKIGDVIELTDERGRPFRLRLVGGLANSILQGSLVIDEGAFQRLFPGETGFRFFLIDAPTDRWETASAALSRALEDVGLELTPATRRLAQFNAVQNTYLTTFQVLGGLGLLLGSAGLGVVVLRNVLERRGELALLTAVGFRRRQLSAMILAEHAALLAIGLGIGLGSAWVAILPSVLSPAAELPLSSLAFTLGGVVLLGLLTTWLATRASLRGSLLAALRGE